MNRTVWTRWLAIVLAIAALCALAGCNRDENDTEDSRLVTDPLTGQWQSERKPDYVYTFNGDGTGTYKMAGIQYDLTYHTDNGQITIAILAQDYTPLTLDYFLEGDRLNIRDSYGKDTFYVRVEPAL